MEKGHNKAIDVEFRGVQGLGKWLWSVADLYRKGALVQFAEPALGGSFIKLKNSEEKIPIEFVSNKYCRLSTGRMRRGVLQTLKTCCIVSSGRRKRLGSQ